MTEVRLRFGKGARARFDVVDERRASIWRAMARDLTKADVDPERAKRMLEDAAKASDGELRAIRALVAELTSGIAKPKARLRLGVTFRALAEDWVSGELNKRWPDHVKLKRSADLGC